uniref:Uncharacterized protein LOC102810128 n=1 Tax=Saccoglossus kowalevskii TaxID=10224 RepID=A0ABM0N189_SACKO|nr:PREDICTED: uncharacterized protein LOC102810128 [Saccoglossus kowalevskii]
MSHILEKAISVISQQPNDRKDVDIDLLIPWFKKKSDLFQGATPEVVKDIIRNCQYLHAAQDDVIINQGDIGNSFYIILSGQVAVYIRNTQSDDEDEVSDDEARTKTKERRSRTSSKRASSKTSVGSARHLRDLENGDELPESSDDDNAEGGDDDNEGDDDDTNTVTEAERRASYRPLDRSEFGTHIRFVGAGGSFGELALLHENCVRNASVIANAVTDMIVVDRDLYSRSLKAAQEHELKEKYAFIDTYPLFRSVN